VIVCDRFGRGPIRYRGSVIGHTFRSIASIAGVSVGLILSGGCSGGSKGGTASKATGSGHPATYTVTSYDGCRGNGTTNCYAGLQAAINAAQAAGGGTVYLPPGTYRVGSSRPLVIAQGPGVTLTGENAATTSIVAGTASPTLLMVKADHAVVSNLTFDSSTVHGGHAVVTVTASYDRVDHCRILGGPGTSWPLRFAGGQGSASPAHPSYATGNTIDSLFLHDYAPGRNDGLDFSFQQDAMLSNIQQIGSRLGLYVDRDVKVTNYTFTPEPTLSSGTYGYYITPPSYDITIEGFTTSGNGGKIGPTPPGLSTPRTNVNITIDHERMTQEGYSIVIGDVAGLVIRDSVLQMVKIVPNVGAQGVIEGTTYTRITQSGAVGASISIEGAGN
jgi:Pectate lyase superfamily protein